LGGGERYALLRGNAGCFHSLILYSWPGIPIIWNRVFHTDRIPRGKHNPPQRMRQSYMCHADTFPLFTTDAIKTGFEMY